jgi:hypothetical protein
MECEICKRTVTQDSVTLHRINEKGVKGIWRCETHLPPGFVFDPVVQDIGRIIEEDNRRKAL